uniref:Oxidoreductase n=4 Tax=Mycobacterium TaxID=1763 RepID=H6U2N8_MYCKA|nr:oxidoreductase [Mycobacterium kansasii]AKT73086.1 oxidoreductase [Mycobacterium avium subsp. hominissuis]
MCSRGTGGKMQFMAAKFTLDADEAEAGLSAADAATAKQAGSSLQSLTVGGYGTPLLGAALGALAVGNAQAVGRATANTGSREFSIATVQAAEAGNSSVLTT